LTAVNLQDMFETEFSEDGSNNKLIEESIVYNFMAYIQDTEGVFLYYS